MKMANIDRESLHIFWTNFNEIFRKDVTYDDITSHKSQSFTLSLKNTFLEKPQGGQILKEPQGDPLNLFRVNEIIWLVIMKTKMKNRSHSYDINRRGPRQRHRHTKYKVSRYDDPYKCNKQYFSNIWSSIHEKVKQHWGWMKKDCRRK